MENSLPLSGIKVIDFTRVVAGPVCTMNLAQMGAEVIKVEATGKGDDTRANPPFIEGESAYFMLMNGNKKSLTLDMKDPKGKEILWKLIESADVIVENFRPGVLKKLGFGYETVAAKNPRIVYCSVSGYGSDDDTGAYDPIIQAESGFMSVTGEPQGMPMKVAAPVGDLVSALYATQGVLYALLHRHSTGKGQYVDISMLSSMVSLLHLPGSIYLGTAENPKRLGNTHPSFAPYQLYTTQDNFISIACGNDSLWSSFCQVTCLEHLKVDARFLKNKDRVANRDQLNGIIQPVMITKTTAEWRELFTEAGVPNGRIRTIKEVFADETLVKKQIVHQVEHPNAGNVKMLGNPVKMSSVVPKYQPAPTLGANNTEILLGLGYTAEQIKELCDNNII